MSPRFWLAVVSAFLAALGGGVLLLRTTATPPPPQPVPKNASVQSSEKPVVHRHDFGKVLCGAGSVLERVFTIRNDGAEAVELKEFQGFPSCCVTLEPIAPVQKTLMAGESFAARMTIDPAPKPGPETWRGIVTTADRKRSFFVEAAADMLPVVYAAWDDDTAVELEPGSSTVRSGAVQIIGEGSPQGLRI